MPGEYSFSMQAAQIAPLSRARLRASAASSVLIQRRRGLSPLTYWQALAFLILVSVLGSFFIGARGLPVMVNYDAKAFK